MSNNSIITGFSLSNYASFGEEVTLDLTQNITGLYGKNACGKTSLIAALKKHTDIINFFHMMSLPTRNVFALSNILSNETTSKISFIFKDKEYEHFLIYIINEGYKVVYEYFGYKNGERIFEIDTRKEQKIEDIFNQNIEKEGAQSYYDSYYRNNSSILKHFISFFKYDIGDLSEVTFACQEEYNMVQQKQFLLQKAIPTINDYIWYLDKDIVGIFYDEGIKIKHKKNDGTEVIFNINEESNGTQKIIYILFYLIKVLQEGSNIIIDEIDSMLHPEVLEFIITLFKDPEYNKNNAKLIFTSHNVDIFDYLNKENIVIVEKINGMSSLKHLKEDTEYSKDNIKNEFVRGVYGSFPNIKKEHFKSKLFPDNE